MKKADAQTLLTLMDELTELMTEYDRRTDRMVTNDLEVIQQVLLSRNELMDKMRQVKQSIMDTANAQVPAERELIRDILNNKPVTENLSYELRQLQSKMRHLHDIENRLLQQCEAGRKGQNLQHKFITPESTTENRAFSFCNAAPHRSKNFLNFFIFPIDKTYKFSV